MLSISLPQRGERDSGMIRNSCENSTEPQLQLRGQLKKIMFGSSRQSHYSSGSERKWTRGFSKHKVSYPSVQKEID